MDGLIPKNPIQSPGQGRPNQNPFGIPDSWNPFGSSTGRQEPQRPQLGRPGYGQGVRPNQNPFGIPGIPDSWNPFGSSTGRQEPQRPQHGYGYGQSQPGRGGGRPTFGGRPQQPSPNTNPQKPRPQPKPVQPKQNPVPGLDLGDIFGKSGILDQIPDVPQVPQFSIGGFNFQIPSFGRRQRREGKL